MYRDEIDARIKMADEAIVTLRTDIFVFCEEQRPHITIESDDQGQGRVVRLQQDRIPVEWSIRIGIAAYLLRSSLDHLVWQLVLTNGNTPDRRNQFPIFMLGEKPDDKRVNRMLNGIAKRHKDTILAFSLDCTKNLEPLWNLKALCNIDKHRHAHVVLSTLTGLSAEYRRKECLDDEEGRGLPEVGKDDLDMQVRFQDEGDASAKEWQPRGEVVGTLEACSGAVKGIIAHILEGAAVSWPFLRSLGNCP